MCGGNGLTVFYGMAKPVRAAGRAGTAELTVRPIRGQSNARHDPRARSDPAGSRKTCVRHHGHRGRAAVREALADSGDGRITAVRHPARPHVLEFFGTNRPIADFFAEIGKLLLMFSAGLEIDVAQFRAARKRSLVFGVVTTTAPLVLGSLYGLLFGYSLIPAIVIGSLLASHTLFGLSVVTRMRAVRLEPIVVTIRTTVVSDTLSLVVFAICVDIHNRFFARRHRRSDHRNCRFRATDPDKPRGCGDPCEAARQ